MRVKTAGQDHTNASMRKWLIQEHILGQTGIGNPNISAIYLDDDWQTTRGAESPSPLGGPTEIGYPLLTENGTLYDGVIAHLHGYYLFHDHNRSDD